MIGKQNSIQKQRIVLCELHVTHCQPIINELLVWIKIKIIFIITNCLLPSNIYRCYQYDLIMRYDQANFKINTLYVWSPKCAVFSPPFHLPETDVSKTYTFPGVFFFYTNDTKADCYIETIYHVMLVYFLNTYWVCDFIYNYMHNEMGKSEKRTRKKT